MKDRDTELRKVVEKLVYNDQPTLIAFDGCHKIYAALDVPQREWFMENSEDAGADAGYKVFFSHDEDEMIQTLLDWYEDSCMLRFISTIQGEAGAEVFNSPIPQCWEEQFMSTCQECGCDVDDGEDICYDCEWEQNHEDEDDEDE